MKRFSLGAMICLITVSSCTFGYRPPSITEPLTYFVVTSFDDYKEILTGTAIAPLDGTSAIQIAAAESDVRCSGTSLITYTPPIKTNSCSGQQGLLQLDCTDERIVEGNFYLTSCEDGYATGRDQDGNTLTFVFSTNKKLAHALYDQQAAAASARPSVAIYRPSETRAKDTFSTGTAFYVSNVGHLVTNYHVIKDADSIVIFQPDGNALSAEVVATDPANDVALIKASVKSTPLAVADRNGLSKGAALFTLGYPLIEFQDQQQKVTFGRVNALTGIQGDVRFVQIDVPVQPGNSGGPLFDSAGRVVGIVTDTLDQLAVLRDAGVLPQNVNYAVKSDYIVPLLRVNGIPVPQTSVSAARDVSSFIERAESSVVLVMAHSAEQLSVEIVVT